MESGEDCLCPKCGFPAEPGGFCSECGYEMPAVELEKVAEVAGKVADATDSLAGIPSSVMETVVEVAATAPVIPMQVLPQEKRVQWSEPEEGDQSPIEVAVKMPDAFLEGCMSAITFRLRSRSECFSYVTIIVRRDSYEVGRAVVPHKITEGEVTDLIVNVTPECHGNMAIQFDLECKREDARDIEQYVSNAISVLVWPRQQDSTGHSVTINNTNTYSDIKVSGAGDADFSKGGHDDLVTAIGKLTKDNYSEKIAQYAKDKPFCHVQFRVAKLPNRLTIVSSDGLSEIILISANEISFGRGRENDAILMVLDETGAVDEDRTAMISRKHFRISYENHRCYVADGTIDKETNEAIPSSLGTEYDGERISASRGVMVTAGETHTIVLSPDVTLDYAIRLTIKALGCPQAHKAVCKNHCPSGTSAVLMSREDKAKLFLIVWKCVDMGEFLPGYEGYYIHRSGDRFMLYRPDGVRCILLPGNEYGKEENPFFVTVNGMGH